MDKLPSVQVIVLNWNGRFLLKACLKALSNLDYPLYEVLLVDNDSTDGSVDYVRRSFAHIAILQNDNNLGYAGGNNRALRALNADYAVLVNPDIIVSADFLSELILPMDADDSIGIAGCKLLYPDEQTIQHAGGFITHPQAMPAHEGMFEHDTGQYETSREVDYVTGAAIAIKGSALEKIGLLDEGFFMYFEEADWCARARAAEYRVVYLPRATAVHDESAIAVKGSYSYLQRFHTGRWRYVLKHFDVGEILSTTFAAEERWLLKSERIKWHALKHVYRAVYTGLDEIIAARLAHGGTHVSSSQLAELELGLVRLRKLAIAQAVDQQNMARVIAKAQVQETSFQSKIPVIGVLVAQLRSLWASVAAREQIKTFTIQQSEFNEHLAMELQEMEIRFQTLQLDLLAHDEKQVDLERHQSELKAELHRARKLLEVIKIRIRRIEDLSHD
jgi:GT2 family glycosyltransferase